MKKRVLAFALLSCIFMAGCSNELKIEKPLTASANIDSYVDAVQAERYNITGNTTLEPGDYVVYPNAGQTCLISDSSIGQEFNNRDFIHVIKTVDVNISNGYLLPLDKAPALNGEIANNGVYLVGFDILPEKNVVGTSSMVVVCDTIPNLFESAFKSTYAKYEDFEAKEGMVVKLCDTYLVSRTSWDVQARTSAFWGSYVNTAIDAAYDATSSLNTAKTNYLILYGLALEAKQIDGDIVKLESDEDISFNYKNETYTLPSKSAYTICSNSSAITPNDNTTKKVQSYKEYVNGGEDKTGITDTSTMLFYILGDYYDVNTVKTLSDSGELSIQYLSPTTESTSPISTANASELSEGDLLIKATNTSNNTISAPVLKLYDAMNAQLSVDNKIVVSKSGTVPNGSSKYGCYRVSIGSLNNSGFSYSLSENEARLTVEGDYVILYEGCPTYMALEDTTLVGVPMSEVLDYYKRISTGEVSVVKKEEPKTTDTFKKSYKVSADTVMEIGSTMSANTYTFADYADVTVYPYANGKAHRYPSCKQLILQSGDKFAVTEDAIMTAEVTSSMDMAEKEAEAIAAGYTPKTYTIKKSFVAGRDLPVLEYTVDSDVNVTLDSGETYKKGDMFIPKEGVTVSVSAECNFSGMEPVGVEQSGNRYDVFMASAKAGKDIESGKYELVGGNATIAGNTITLGDTIELKDEDIISTGWFALVRLDIEDVSDTEGL